MDTNRTVEPRVAMFIIAGIVGFAALVGVVLSGDSDDPFNGPDLLTDDNEQSEEESTAEPPADPGVATAGPDVPPINCSALLTTDEVSDALAVWEREPIPSTMEFSLGETCLDEFFDDSEYFVSIGPGEVTDFVPGQPLDGVIGRPADGVGDDAVWFDGVGAGTLAVYQETELGVVVFRVAIGRPDVDGSTRLDLARTLATAALPRFPGVEQPEPTLVSFEPEPFDRSVLGYDENLLVKEEAGDWTREEGLIATLEILTGDRAQSGVLRSEELFDLGGSGIIRLAQEYVASGPDDDARATIEGLLDELLLSREELDQLLADAAVRGEQPDEDGEDESALGVPSTGTVVLIAFRPPAQDESCLFGCSEQIEVGKHLVIAPSPPTETWTKQKINEVVAAVGEAGDAYDALGTMPGVTIILSSEGGWAWTDTAFDDLHTLYLKGDLAELGGAELQQEVAKQMAYSFLVENLDALPFEGLEAWWADGLSLFLSALVYENADLEHRTLEKIATAAESGTSLVDWGPGTWLFFQHMWNELSEDQFSEFLGSLNDLENFEAIDFHWQRFNELLAVGLILDSEGKRIPYKVTFGEFTIEGPNSIGQTLSPFSVLRLTIKSGGEDACMSFESNGVNASFHFGPFGPPSSPDLNPSWDDVPTGLPANSEAQLMITSVKPGATFSLNVRDKEEGEDCSVFDTDEPTRPSEPCDEMCGPSGFFMTQQNFFEFLGDLVGAD